MKKVSSKNSTYLVQMYIEMVLDHDLRENGVPAAPDFSVRHSLLPLAFPCQRIRHF